MILKIDLKNTFFIMSSKLKDDTNTKVIAVIDKEIATLQEKEEY